ncbi:MAG: hypothetical protein PHU67_06195 [Sulfurovum sp.]|nr:hypothetical protein [Sulfurovum sp.]MDD3499699.1 hypothetical protein [Sulfurovum sp.]
MMSSATLFRFLLIALFLFAYQTTTIHSKHHHLADFDGCQVCKASKSLGASHHETVFSLPSENIAVEVSEVEEKRVVRPSFDLTQIPERKILCFEGMLAFEVAAPLLGFDAHAPPSTLS